MKVFSLNKKSDMVFWSAWTNSMVKKAVKNNIGDYIYKFREAMLGESARYSYLEEKYNEFTLAETEEERYNIFATFAYGCIKNEKLNSLKAEVSIIDATDESETNRKNCVSDLVLRTTEGGFDALINDDELLQVLGELEEAREFIIEVDGIDIYRLILHASSKLRGTAQLETRAIEQLRETIKKYNIADLFMSVMHLDGAIDCIERRVLA